MRRSALAKLLIAAANDGERKRLLRRDRSIADERLATELRDICYASWTNEPITAQRAASAAKVLAAVNDSPLIAAIAQWITGIAEITSGGFERAVTALRQAAKMFQAQGRDNDAAQTRVAELLALAMPGRYDEAVAAGEAALRFFVRTRDHLAAGKVAMNLGNVVSRQGRHHEAEVYGLAARRHFTRADEANWLAMAENGLANTYAELNQFAKARRFYEKALTTAKALKMAVTEAEIEASLGNLAVLRGQYSEAIRYLERSRQRYAELGMPHQSAVADLEVADIYCELNLLAEAVEIYRRVVLEFLRQKLRAEEARARLHHGRAAAGLGDSRTARSELARAQELFQAEGNYSGQVSALSARADLAVSEGRFDEARKVLEDARPVLRRDDDPRHEITVKLLTGRTLAASGEAVKARRVLAEAERLAANRQHTNALQSIRNELGKLALKADDHAGARRHFRAAIRDIESLRSNVGADEFSVAFLGDKREPFDNLTRLLLDEKSVAAAFRTVERSRSRALLDAMDARPQAAGPAAMRLQVDDARSRLNFLYRTLDRDDGGETARLRTEILAAEKAFAGVIRRFNSLTAVRGKTNERLDLKELQRKLGGSHTLVEYIEIDGIVSAFVVDDKKVRYVAGLGSLVDVRVLLDEMHFQFETQRYGGERLSRYTKQMKLRADRSLMRLYDLLLRPLADRFAGSELVIVPVGVLHYVPFHALHDGQGYLVETHETVYAPSAAVWAKLKAKRVLKPRSSLVMGYADDRIPMAEREAKDLSKALPMSDTFSGKRATFEAFTTNAVRHDLIHLACHGEFRGDNPMFSSLHLADGWVTVQDICSRRIRASLVTLSACETGMSKVGAGDELLGLVRGFLSAGAASLVVSLWTVNDRAASELMRSFYSGVTAGLSPSASLRAAQLQLIARGEHPFLWSPFIAVGR